MFSKKSSHEDIGLMTVEKDGEQLDIHPTTLEAHQRAGWKVVEESESIFEVMEKKFDEVIGRKSEAKYVSASDDKSKKRPNGKAEAMKVDGQEIEGE